MVILDADAEDIEFGNDSFAGRFVRYSSGKKFITSEKVVNEERFETWLIDGAVYGVKRGRRQNGALITGLASAALG